MLSRHLTSSNVMNVTVELTDTKLDDIVSSTIIISHKSIKRTEYSYQTSLISSAVSVYFSTDFFSRQKDAVEISVIVLSFSGWVWKNCAPSILDCKHLCTDSAVQVIKTSFLNIWRKWHSRSSSIMSVEWASSTNFFSVALRTTLSWIPPLVLAAAECDEVYMPRNLSNLQLN